MASVVGRVLGQTVHPISGHHGGVVAEASEALPGQSDQVGFDVHGEHVLLAEPVAQQRGVVAGAGPDLQHPAPVANVKRFERGTARKAACQ